MKNLIEIWAISPNEPNPSWAVIIAKKGNKFAVIAKIRNSNTFTTVSMVISGGEL